MTKTAFIQATVDWLNRRVVRDGTIVDADTRLFETGVVDSLAILRLIAWTESLTGRRIDDREIRMDRFASVRLIAESFAESALGAERGAERGCAAERCAACGSCARARSRRAA